MRTLAGKGRAGPTEREIVLAILQYLQAKHKDWCWIRCEPPAAIRAALRRTMGTTGFRPHQPEDAWGDGVADILGIGITRIRVNDTGTGKAQEWAGPGCPVAFEVKSATGKQRDSQKAFQARWERAGGRYYIVRSVDEVQRALGEMLA